MLESTPASQARIATLRKRWEADRGSSAFLPLAEEYRRLGRFRDAIDTLEAGLRMQPAYLSAQVALGRCLLESGDAPAAGQVLERGQARGDIRAELDPELMIDGLVGPFYSRVIAGLDAGPKWRDEAFHVWWGSIATRP